MQAFTSITIKLPGIEQVGRVFFWGVPDLECPDAVIISVASEAIEFLTGQSPEAKGEVRLSDGPRRLIEEAALRRHQQGQVFDLVPIELGDLQGGA